MTAQIIQFNRTMAQRVAYIRRLAARPIPGVENYYGEKYQTQGQATEKRGEEITAMETT